MIPRQRGSKLAQLARYPPIFLSAFGADAECRQRLGLACRERDDGCGHLCDLLRCDRGDVLTPELPGFGLLGQIRIDVIDARDACQLARDVIDALLDDLALDDAKRVAAGYERPAEIV